MGQSTQTSSDTVSTSEASTVVAGDELRDADPRESEVWFMELCEEERELLVERWDWEGRRELERADNGRRERRDSMIVGAIIFTIGQCMIDSDLRLLVAPVLGCGVGLLWVKHNADRVLSGVIMVVAFFLSQIVLHLGLSSNLTFTLGFALAVVAGLSAISGLRREFADC